MVHHVTKTYIDTRHHRETVAIRDVSCIFPSGEIIAILGPSGCGKSTLLKMIANIIEPSLGLVMYGDEPIATARLQGRFGYVSQSSALLPQRTVRENIALPLELGRQAQIPMDELLTLVGLTSAADQYPHQLSVGMQQRTSLARALISHPDILLMDEPFSALDELTREKLQGDFLRIHRATPSTILFVTHSIEEAVFLSNRVFCLSTHGTLLAEIPITLPQERTMETRRHEDFSALTYALRSVLKN